MRILTKYIIAAGLILFTKVASAGVPEISFEGIFRIEQDKNHIGYLIQRVETDSDTKKRAIITYTKTVVAGKTSTSISRAYADENYVPLNVNFTSDETGVHESIKASFGGPTTTVDFKFNKSNKDARKDSLKASEGSFISGFLFYILDLASLEPGKAKNYDAYSEDDGKYSSGKVKLVATKTIEGQKILQIDDFFTGDSIENFVLPNGDPIGSRSGFHKTFVYLTSKAEAVKEFEFPQKELTEVFRDLPEGRKNPIALSEGKLDAQSIMKSFEVLKVDPITGSEEDPVMDIKVPKRGK